MNDEFCESVALCDAAVLDDYLENGELSAETIQQMIIQRQVFPCYFGSALKMTGTAELLLEWSIGQDKRQL